MEAFKAAQLDVRVSLSKGRPINLSRVVIKILLGMHKLTVLHSNDLQPSAA